ncbi:hypothetical protein [Falsiroseomonas sp.]|uniref:hypothetical protein n=1 Tax=Falsiroseomonas sp. TaxID=2870721 RepID=UPI003F7233DE
MAVLVEGISVVVRADAIEVRYPGGLDAFEAAIPNQTACSDGEMVRVGFMVPADVEAYVRSLQAAGLVWQRDGAAQDLVVVDQQSGPLMRCDWLEARRVGLGADGRQRVTIARLIGSHAAGLATPPGWRFEGSPSETFGFAPTVTHTPGLHFLRQENGMDVYWDDLAGQEVFVGRAGRQPR